jgi:putative nucleotidyltransferase with HDIG domain
LGALYRVRQFTLALGSRLGVGSGDEAQQYLDGLQRELFDEMSPVDQRHCLAVARALGKKGHTDVSLLRAALLHDAGKSLGPVRVWHRVAAVLVKALLPEVWERMSGNPSTWTYPLYVHRHHAQLGAELAHKAGSSPEVVWLIAHHEDESPPLGGGQRKHKLLAALKAADHVN